MDFTAFYHDRWAELRTAFRAARYLGIDPDDVVQETMMRARQHHERFASDVELVMWCKRVGANIVRRQARTAYRRRELPCSNPVTAIADARSDNAEDRAVENLDLARTMAALRPQHAKVLVLEAAGLTRDEIASIFEITPSAVGMLLMRARRAAQQCWAKGVAALLLFAFRVRKLNEAPPLPAQALVATVVTASVAVALALPHIAETSSAQTPAPTAAAAHISNHPIATSPPGSAAVAGTPITQPPAQVRLATPVKPGSFAPARLPKMPGACRTARLCPCVDETQPGDYVYLKPEGVRCRSTTEQNVPICQYVVDNPVAGCQRRGHPDWNPIPPPSSFRNGVAP